MTYTSINIINDNTCLFNFINRFIQKNVNFPILRMS